MKRIASAILAALLLCVALTGCVEAESAYDIAVRHGFVGSEEDWLASLQGKDGKDGADGKDGKDGADGADGIDGIDGKDGKDGIDGKDGEDGRDGTAIMDLSTAAMNASLSTVVIQCQYFEEIMPDGTSETEFVLRTKSGTGFFLSVDREKGEALVATNYHVVYSNTSAAKNGMMESISLYLYGDTTFANGIEAEVLGGSVEHDVAILKITGSEILKDTEIRTVTVSEDDIHPGMPVFLVGNANSDGIAVTQGIVSVESEYILMPSLDEGVTLSRRVLRTDAAVNFGNSGGGLFNARGELVAMVQGKMATSDIDNMGYCIPRSLFLAVCENIMENCEGGDRIAIQKALLGVTLIIESSSAVYREACQSVHVVEKVVVDSVTPDSLADGSLLAGDVVLTFGIGGKAQAKDVTRMHQVVETMLTASVGDTVYVSVLRDGEVKEFSFTVGEENIVK